MGLVISAREGDGFILKLEDGRTITITHTRRFRPAQGMQVKIDCDKTIKIERFKRPEPGNEV